MFVDHRHQLIVTINPGTGSLALQGWAGRLQERGDLELWNRPPSWNQGRDLTHLDARELPQVLPESTLRSYRCLHIHRDPGERLRACLQEMARFPTGRRWLNGERIHGLEDLAQRLRRNPALVHNSNIPWLKPQLWFEAGSAASPRQLRHPHAAGWPRLLGLLAGLGYSAAELALLEQEPAAIAAATPAVPPLVQEAAACLERWAAAGGLAAWAEAPAPPLPALTLMQLGPCRSREVWQQQADTWGCAVLERPGADESVEGLLSALEEWLDQAVSAALLLLSGRLELTAQEAERLTPVLQPTALPADWGIIQLAPFWPIAVLQGDGASQVQLLHPPLHGLHRHRPDREWGCDALLVRREYAEALLQRYRTAGSAAAAPGHPSADRLLLDDWSVASPWRSYTLPLLQPAKAGLQGGMETAMRRASRRHHSPLQPQQPAAGRQSWAHDQPDYPFVSIHTVTRNRPRHLEQLQRCLLRQTYPASRMEWVIVDASDADQPRFEARSGPIASRLIRVEAGMRLGAQRNLANQHCRGQIIVCCDDDDYYFPSRVSHAVEALLREPTCMAAGCTLMPLQFWDRDELWLLGPYTANHSTANALAFRRTLLEWRRFDPEAALAEENSFLGEFSEPMVQLDPWQSLICMAHDSNTFRKQVLFEKAAKLLRPSPRQLQELMPAELYKHCCALFQERSAIPDKT